MDDNTQNPNPTGGASQPAVSPVHEESKPPVAEVIGAPAKPVSAPAPPAPLAPQVTPAEPPVTSAAVPPAPAPAVATGQPTPPPSSEAAEPAEEDAASSQQSYSLPAFVWNSRTQDIIIWSIAASIALAYVRQIGDYLGAKIAQAGLLAAAESAEAASDLAATLPPVSFDIISPLTGGIFYGIVTGAVLYFAYRQIFGWCQKKAVGKYLDTFFKIVLFPYLAVALLLTLIGSLTSLKGALVMMVFAAGGHFAYAKILEMKIGKHFEMKDMAAPCETPPETAA